jgi:hypothetical protein
VRNGVTKPLPATLPDRPPVPQGTPWRFKSSHPHSPSRHSRATFSGGLFMSCNGHASTEPRGPKAGHKACFTLGDRGASLGSLGSVHQKVERPRRDLPAGGGDRRSAATLSARPRLRPGRHPSTVTPSIDRYDRRVRGRAERAAKCGQSGSRRLGIPVLSLRGISYCRGSPGRTRYSRCLSPARG